MWQEYLQKHPKSGWDTEVPDEERQSWEEQITKAEQLKSLRFPRLVINPTADDHEFHVFGDASKKAIAACMYVVPLKGNVHLKPRLLGGLTKVVNAKQQEQDDRSNDKFAIKHPTELQTFAPAINRLELSAATMAVALAESFFSVLGGTCKNVSYWTDSENVLRQIHKGGNSCLITKYNQKRVTKILAHSHPTQWRHVDGVHNPADVASRGTPTSQEFLNSNLWLQGPTFLTTGDWPEQKEDLVFQDYSRESLIPLSPPSLDTAEQTQEESNVSTIEELPLILGLNWVKSCEKALAFIREKAGTDPAWANILKHFQEQIRKQRLLETLVVWSAQQKHCQELIRALRSNKIPGPLRNLVTFHNLQLVHVEELANLEIIVSKRRNICTTRKRVEKLGRRHLPNGRVTRRKARNAGCLKELENSLLECETGDMLLYVPSCSKAAYHLVSHYHTVVTAHGSIRIVELTLQQQWLIPKLTRIYKDVRKHCVNCKLIKANPSKLPEGDLLSKRVESRFPFQVTGVDFSGPFGVLRSQRTKLYICIFADAYTRAASL
jgi:hypothetical protein